VAGFGLFHRTSISALKSMMDVSALRQRVYSANIAHATNPDYTRKEVRFDEALGQSVARASSARATQPGHIAGGAERGATAEVYEDRAAGAVDLETETVALAENQLRFNLAARLAFLRIQTLRDSIRGS
jgi:flagellar basal-body rod protein FlgB